MVEFSEEFHAEYVPEDDRSFDPIPAGEYLMQVIESTIAPTKSGSGEILTLTLEVIDGQHANRRIWDRLNIRNLNPEAQRIAQRSLADLCLAVGLTTLRDTEDLHFKPFRARVAVKQPTQAEKDQGYVDPKNTVRYKARGGQPPARPTPAQPAGAQAGAKTTSATTVATHSSGDSKRPWANKKINHPPLDDDIPF